MRAPHLRLLVLSFLACSTGMALRAAPVRAEVISLDQLEKSARERALQADATLEQAEAVVARVHAADRPHLDAEAEAGMRPGSTPIEIRDVNGDAYRVSAARDLSTGDAWIPTARYGIDLKLTDSLYDFGRTRAAEDAAKQARDAAKLGIVAVQDKAARAVIVSYLRWMGAVAEVDAAQDAVKDAQRLEEQVGRLVQAGARPETDREEARAETARATLAQIQAEASLVAARNVVTLASGVPLTARDVPDVSMLTGPPAARTRPEGELEALQARVTAAQVALGAARKADSPVLGGKIQVGAYGSNILLFPAYEAGVSLTVPLWDGGVQSARERAAAADLHATQEALQAAQRLRDVEALAESQKSSDAAAEAGLAAAEQWAALTAAIVPRTEAAFAAGEAKLDAVPKARQTARTAKLTVIQGQITRIAVRLGLRDLPGH